MVKYHLCLFCKVRYPYFDTTIRYYYVNVFGKYKIICEDCKKRLKIVKDEMKGGIKE